MDIVDPNMGTLDNVVAQIVHFIEMGLTRYPTGDYWDRADLNLTYTTNNAMGFFGLVSVTIDDREIRLESRDKVVNLAMRKNILATMMTVHGRLGDPVMEYIKAFVRDVYNHDILVEITVPKEYGAW